MDNRIAIEIELRGKEVLSELKSIEDILNNLNKKTYKVTLSDAGGVGKILLKMQEILEAIKLVNNTPISPKADTSGLDRMAASARKANAEIQTMVRSMTAISKTPLLSGRVMTDWFSFPNGVLAGGARGMAEMWRNTMDTFNSYLWSTLSQSMSVASFSSLAQNVGAWLHNWPLLTHSGLFGDLYNLASQNRLLTGTNRLGLSGNSWATKLIAGGANWYVGPFGVTGSFDQLNDPIKLLTGSVDNFNTKLNDLNSFRLSPKVSESITEGFNPLTKWSEKLSNLSEKLSSIGSTLYAGSNLFSQIASFGFGNLVDTVISTLTSQFTSGATEGLANAFTRYDVFIKYPRIMDAFGIQIDESSQALTKLNDAVLGLPTSLNDIASSATDFVSILSGLGYEGTDLLDRSTDLAIAVNNAVLASGASDSDAQYAIQQLQNLIGTGGLTAIQWRSLRRTIPVALSEISKELGYATWVEMRDAFTSGKISVEQFTDALIKLGTNNGALAQLADISKLTFEAIGANLRNAFSRLIAGRVNDEGEVEGGLLGTLNQLTMERYGEQLPQYVKNRIIPRIDAFGKTLESAILTHQDEIFAFIDKLLAYDWEGLIAKIAKFTTIKWDLMLKVFEKIPESLLAFASVGAEPIAKLLRFLGSLVFLGSGLAGGLGNIFENLAKRGVGADIGWSFADHAPALTGSAGAAGGAIGFGGAMLGTVGALSTIGTVGYAAYKQWNSANEEAETYYLTIDKLNREGNLTAENLEILRKQIEDNISTAEKAYGTYLEDYKKRYELYTNGGEEQSFGEWLPFWARWKMNDYESAISAYETALIRIDNLNFMHTESWQTYKAEADKIGGIPEDLIKAFEEGSVEIPGTLDEFLTLITTWTGDIESEVDSGFKSAMRKGKKQIDQGIDNINQSMDTFVNDFSIYGERMSGQGFFLGDSFGRSLYNSIVSWLNEIFPLLDLTYTKIGNAQVKSTGNKTGTPGEMKKTFQAFGGAIRGFNGRFGNYHDTIPAMLSPGEYVLRKHAVDKIGLDFLNKLNTFNFSGALDSLTQRVGSGMSPYAFAGATANNTRIYNNNAQANITVNNSSQEFTQRRANKWIRGLN